MDDLDEPDQNMDTSRMMFNWATDQGMGQGFTQEQVDGKLQGFCVYESC